MGRLPSGWGGCLSGCADCTQLLYRRDNKSKTEMSKGFYYMGKTYVWHKKELYRLPFCVNLKWYKLLKCRKWSDRGYYLGSAKKSFLQLKEMTKDIEDELLIQETKDTPF